MNAFVKNAQAIKHSLECYDMRRTMQKLVLALKSLWGLIDLVLEIEEYVEEDGSVNARLLHHLIDEAQNRSDLLIQHEEMEANGHDAYTEEETEGM